MRKDGDIQHIVSNDKIISFKSRFARTVRFRVRSITKVILVGLIVVLLSPFASRAGDITLTIGDIRYEGDDQYRVSVFVMNGFSSAVRLTGLEQFFYIQTDKGWKPVRTPGEKDDLKPDVLAAGTKEEFTALIRIPLALPSLFRTYEGDISLQHQYRLRYTGGISNIETGKQDEAYYWITPRTRKWLLREGM